MGAHLPLPLHVAGWVGLSPHLSFHLHPGGDAPHSLAHPYFAGCVAATLVALLIITRVCRCHPYCLHLQGVLLPPSIYAREHPMSLVPFTAKDCVVCIYNYYVWREAVNLNRTQVSLNSFPVSLTVNIYVGGCSCLGCVFCFVHASHVYLAWPAWLARLARWLAHWPHS